MNDLNVLLPHIKLRLNIDHPSYEECYVYGYECAVADVSEEENPYTVGSREHEQWAEGWWAGFYGDEPLFRMAETKEEPELSESGAAANEQVYHLLPDGFWEQCLNLTGAFAATMILGYQVFDLVA